MNESQHASFLSSPHEKWYLFGTFTPHLSYPTFTPVLYFYTNQLLHQTPFTPTSFYTRHLLHQPAFTPDTFYNLSHKTPFTPDTFDKRQLFTPQILLHQTPFTPDAFYTKHPLHLPTFTPHLSHQTPFTSSTFYTTPGRQTKVDSSLWPQRTVPKLPSGTNGCQTLKTATLNTFYFCQKRPLCQPPPSPTPPPYSHFVRKVKLRLAYRLAFVINPSSIHFNPRPSGVMLRWLLDIADSLQDQTPGNIISTRETQYITVPPQYTWIRFN